MLAELPIQFEVLTVMQELRKRDTLRSDSARLGAAIRTIADRRKLAYVTVESLLDSALTLRK